MNLQYISHTVPLGHSRVIGSHKQSLVFFHGDYKISLKLLPPPAISHWLQFFQPQVQCLFSQSLDISAWRLALPRLPPPFSFRYGCRTFLWPNSHPSHKLCKVSAGLFGGNGESWSSPKAILQKVEAVNTCSVGRGVEKHRPLKPAHSQVFFLNPPKMLILLGTRRWELMGRRGEASKGSRNQSGFPAY